MTEFYPGTHEPVRDWRDVKEELPEPDIDIDGLDFRGTGYFLIGILAYAMNRQPVTMRKWETDGIIPKPTLIRSSNDKRGKRRIYTKDQILGLREIAREEGVLTPTANGHWKSIEDTNFSARALELFRKLEKS